MAIFLYYVPFNQHWWGCSFSSEFYISVSLSLLIYKQWYRLYQSIEPLVFDCCGGAVNTRKSSCSIETRSSFDLRQCQIKYITQKKVLTLSLKEMLFKLWKIVNSVILKCSAWFPYDRNSRRHVAEAGSETHRGRLRWMEAGLQGLNWSWLAKFLAFLPRR